MCSLDAKLSEALVALACHQHGYVDADPQIRVRARGLATQLARGLPQLSATELVLVCRERLVICRPVPRRRKNIIDNLREMPADCQGERPWWISVELTLYRAFFRIERYTAQTAESILDQISAAVDARTLDLATAGFICTALAEVENRYGNGRSMQAVRADEYAINCWCELAPSVLQTS